MREGEFFFLFLLSLSFSFFLFFSLLSFFLHSRTVVASEGKLGEEGRRGEVEAREFKEGGERAKESFKQTHEPPRS